MTSLVDKFIEDLTDEERQRLELVEGILPALKSRARQADVDGEFPMDNLEEFRKTGLTGLVIPKEYGGLGGGLRDLTAATFAIGSVCPSTALCFFFHCSTSSRGLLAMAALEEGLFNDEEQGPVRNFAEKILGRMGHEKLWFGNFASESVKSEKSLITIATKAKKVDGGYQLNGVKAFGCSTGVADYYLVTAQLEGYEDASGLTTFFVSKDAEGVSERGRWDAMGLRATATHGIILKDVFVADEEALAIPAAFTRMMQMSRGSFVGNQIAGTAVYLGAAQGVYDDTLDTSMSRKYQDSDRSIAESPMHQELIGRMAVNLETAMLWMRRQLQLETTVPPILPKDEVIKNWRLCKGVVTDATFDLAVDALKCCGTSGTANTGSQAFALRNMAMGLVQAFPSERGRLEAAQMIVKKQKSSLFTGGRS